MRSINQLTILKQSGISFTDISFGCFDYLRDEESFEIKNADDKFLFVGYYKPVNQLYFEFKTPDTIQRIITIKYWNKTTLDWESLTGFHDDTKGFTRSGFINWERQQKDQDLKEVNSIELYWYKFEVIQTSIIEVKGINLVFADDNNLKQEVPEIMNYLPEGHTTFINFHVAARNEIIQILRNKGFHKMKENKFSAHWGEQYRAMDKENLTPWDILDIGEIRTPATYLALAKIFRNLSDKPEDYYETKARYFANAFEKFFKVNFLTIDINDDGEISAKENLAGTTRYMNR